jgi:hypothetical protein
VREEFFSVYKQQQKLVEEQERLSKELEECGEDMTRMQVCRRYSAVRQIGSAAVGCVQDSALGKHS